jgi:hypothetical protein
MSCLWDDMDVEERTNYRRLFRDLTRMWPFIDRVYEEVHRPYDMELWSGSIVDAVEDVVYKPKTVIASGQ